MAYTNDDTNFPLPLSSVCNNTDIDNGLLNVSNLGQLYVNKLLQDDTFNMVSGLYVCRYVIKVLREVVFGKSRVYCQHRTEHFGKYETLLIVPFND